MFEIKENTTFLPMVLMSRLNHIKNMEVHYVHERTTQQSRCAYLSATFTPSYGSLSHDPFFSAFGKERQKRWALQQVIFQAILMAYDSSASLKDRFVYARQCLVEMFPNRLRPGKTYQGFVKAIGKIPSGVREQLQLHLCRHHEQVAGRSWKLFGWIPFAADGSRIEVPRTQVNQEALGCAGKDKTGPQFLVMLLVHMGSALPWRWKIGAGTDSERGHLRTMLEPLPLGSLLVADAGFTGFDLLKDIVSHHLFFLIRVGANVPLLTHLGFKVQQRGDIVWLWPQRKHNQAPLKLRLIRLKVKTTFLRGPQEIGLLTNVFDPERLSDEVAGKFYQMRWGVELFYRSFKRTLDQHKLRSRAPQQAAEELHWALTAMLLLGLMSVSALATEQHDPGQLSVAKALRTVRQAMRTNDRWRSHGDLRILLAQAIKDDYKRRGSKKARDWPHKKKESPPGVPKIRPAKPNEIDRATRSYKAV